MNSLEEEKESELLEVQEELRSAQEEVLMLQQAAEEAAAERENDIACLQEELCRLRAELQRLHAAAKESEVEIAALRAEISARSPGGHAHTPGRTGPSLHVLTTSQMADGSPAFILLVMSQIRSSTHLSITILRPIVTSANLSSKANDDKTGPPPDWNEAPPPISCSGFRCGESAGGGDRLSDGSTAPSEQ